MGTAERRIHVQYPRQPFPKQRQFLDLVTGVQYRHIGYGGAMGGGKSAALALAGLLLSIRYPGNLGLIGRRDFSDLRTTTYQEFLDTVPAELVKQHHRGEHWVDLYTHTPGVTSRVMFTELKDWESHKSLNLGWFAIDEATEVARDAWLLLLSRLRRPGIPPAAYKALAATNPGPGWFRDTFARPLKTSVDTVFVPALPRDNPFLPADYVDRLRGQYPEIWVQRFLDGNWDVFEGQVFTEWDRDVHVVDPFAIPPSWTVWAGMDYGATNPAACIWLAHDGDGNTFAFREYYQRGRTPHDQAADVQALSAPPLIFGDPATRAKTMERAGSYVSVMDQWREAGLNVVPANNDIMAGLMRIKSLLARRPERRHYRSGEPEGAALYVMRSCPNLIREMENMAWQQPRSDDLNRPERPVDANDHAVDALRYGLQGAGDVPERDEVVYLEDVLQQDYRVRIGANRQGW